MHEDEDLLTIKELQVSIMTIYNSVDAVRGVNLTIKKGEVHGIVGESGCGKSMLVKSLMRLHDEAKTDYHGQIIMDSADILKMNKKQLLKLRGEGISMVFQNPMTALDPIMRCGDQITEMLHKKRKLKKQEAKRLVLDMFDKLGILPAEKRYNQYPFEMSGGMLQRVIIAMALVCNPKLLIADEPTTALDVTIQAQILELMKKLQKEFNATIIFITHDLGVIAEICDRVSVMYAGKIVESSDIVNLFDHPAHPYTKALLESNPKSGNSSVRMESIPGSPPSLLTTIEGCSFAPRCKYVCDKCRNSEPQMQQLSENHVAACHYASELFTKGSVANGNR